MHDATKTNESKMWRIKIAYIMYTETVHRGMICSGEYRQAQRNCAKNTGA